MTWLNGWSYWGQLLVKAILYNSLNSKVQAQRQWEQSVMLLSVNMTWYIYKKIYFSQFGKYSEMGNLRKKVKQWSMISTTWSLDHLYHTVGFSRAEFKHCVHIQQRVDTELSVWVKQTKHAAVPADCTVHWRRGFDGSWSCFQRDTRCNHSLSLLCFVIKSCTKAPFNLKILPHSLLIKATPDWLNSFEWHWWACWFFFKEKHIWSLCAKCVRTGLLNPTIVYCT